MEMDGQARRDRRALTDAGKRSEAAGFRVPGLDAAQKFVN